MNRVLEGMPRVHPSVGVQRVGGRLLAAGPDEQLHSFEDEEGNVSEVAERIVELADGTRTVRQIVEQLCQEFEVEPDVCERDTAEFVQLLVEKKVLVL